MPRETIASLKEKLARRDADIAALNEMIERNAAQSEKMMDEINRLTNELEVASKLRVWETIAHRSLSAADDAQVNSLMESISELLSGTFSFEGPEVE